MTDTSSEGTAYRDRYAGRLTSSDLGRTLSVTGWVHRRRDLGGLLFVDLRDRGGLLQVSFGPDWTDEEALERAFELGAEDVIRVTGTVEERPDPNPEMATGEIELRATSLERLNRARTPAIPVYRGPEEELPSEELRLRHRVLDLRRAELRERIELRHRLVLATRNYLDDLGFTEVETPILTKPTPEGARDYLVPSRVHPGEFFALPQSPQIYKQILMAAGFDRYFQIARCFRDEDLRADRQPEFSQIDLEASFISVEDLLGWMEGLMVRLAGVAGLEAEAPFARMTYADALERFGTDRPDLRWSVEIEDWTEAYRGTEFRVVSGVIESGGRLRGIRLEGGAALSRRQIDELEEVAKKAGALGMLWLKREGDLSGSLARFSGDDEAEAIGLEEGDLALMVAGPDRVTSPALSAVRLAAVRALELEPEVEDAWLWVVDFPVFEADPDSGAMAPNHHPFVMPVEEDLELLDSDPTAARGQAYDLVYNGSELGSGSLRIHDPALQRRIFELLGLSDDEVETKFGFLLEALASGAPPHGGVAFGVDRMVKDFARAASLRDVIAFPKTTAARALFEGAPTRVSAGELEALGIEVRSR